jgi:predicted small lipoprotein YifL
MSRCSAWSAMALLVASSVIAGCGQKGPLYMPAPRAATPAPVKPVAADAADNKAKPAEAPTAPAR